MYNIKKKRYGIMLKYIENVDLVFWIAFVVSIGLIVGGFFAPPLGVIDGSVLTGAGILSAFVELHHFIKTGSMRRNEQNNK